jgi:hypothetical protein
MSRSDLQIEASRANGSNSRGPVTAAGKLASSRNAMKHGILSSIVLLPGEDPESFEADAQDLFDEHKPVGPTEQEFVEMMIVARWRRTRIWMMEKTCMAGQLMREYHQAQEPKPSLTTATALAFVTMADNSRTLDLLNRYESRYDRQYFRAHRRLLEVQDRRMRNEPDNTPPPAPGHHPSTPRHQRPGPQQRRPPPRFPRPAPQQPRPGRAANGSGSLTGVYGQTTASRRSDSNVQTRGITNDEFVARKTYPRIDSVLKHHLCLR